MLKNKNRSIRSKTHIAKSDKEPVMLAAVDPSTTAQVLKRGPGRPRKEDPFGKPISQQQPTIPIPTDPKALIVFRRMMADAEKMMMTPADFDGGGTSEEAPIVTKESLQRRVARRLNVLDRFLTDDKLIELLSFSSLKEVGIYEGIMLDKTLVLTGQPNVIIGNEDRGKMDQVMPRLLTEMKRRGLITTVSERKIEFTNP